MKRDLIIVLIGLFLVGLSQLSYAFYNPYINYGYDRPYYTQYNAYPGIARDPAIYGGLNYGYSYSNGFESYYETISDYGSYYYDSYDPYYAYGGYYNSYNAYAPVYVPTYPSYYPVTTSYYVSPATSYYPSGVIYDPYYYAPIVAEPVVVYWG